MVSSPNAQGATPKTERGHGHPSLCQAAPSPFNTSVGMFHYPLDKYICSSYLYIMATIRLFTLTTGANGTQFILKDYPGLETFMNYIQKKDIKRINVDQYFRGIKRDYRDHVKMVYGPVFGMDDPRNGFIYEHKTSGELLRVDEADIPTTYESCNVIYGDLAGIFRTDVNVKHGIVTEYKDMTHISSMVNDQEYTRQIRDEWIPDKSFLVID